MRVRLRFAAVVACLLAGCRDPLGTSRNVILAISELDVPAEAPANTAVVADIRYTVHEYRAEPPLSDPFTVVAKQPDGTETTKVVRIR